MKDRTQKVLLVEPDAVMLDMLVDALTRLLNPHITCVADASSCLDVEMVDPHDLVIAEWRLGGTDGVALAGKLATLGDRPIVLLAADATRDEIAEAMRSGVRDVFFRPFPIERLVEVGRRLLREHAIQRRRAAKYRRMRELVRRVVSERRDLNQRIELVCRDLVGAQRRLVHRVLAIEQQRFHPPN